jgi:hypothetical protein
MKVKMDKLATLLTTLRIAKLGNGRSGESAPENVALVSKAVIVRCLLCTAEVLAETSQLKSIKIATPKGAQLIAV